MQKQKTDDAQLPFSFSRPPDVLRALLERELGQPVSLVITSNSTTMLSFKKQGDGLQVRLQGLFLNAADEVLTEIVSFLRSRRRRPMPLFRKFLRENRGRIEEKPGRKAVMKTAGRWHDLQALYDAVNQEYFSGAVSAAITWGARCSRRAVRKRTLGSFSERQNVMRINPVLDRKTVPCYYIAFVVYHEMLHAAMGIQRRGERRSMHSREFRRREKLFQEYEKAIAWEKGNA